MLQEQITICKSNHAVSKPVKNIEEEHFSLHDDSCHTKTNQMDAMLSSKVRNHDELS